MKKILLVLCVISGLSACNSDTAAPPMATIDGMFTAMRNGNIDEMKKYITRSDVSMLETAEKLLTALDSGSVKTIKDRIMTEMKERSKGISYTLKNEKINGDVATIETEVMMDGKKETHNLELVKEDGAWKIALSRPGNGMFNSMKGDMGSDRKGNQLEDGLEKLKNMNPDSLKMMLQKGAQAIDSLNKKAGKQ